VRKSYLIIMSLILTLLVGCTSNTPVILQPSREIPTTRESSITPSTLTSSLSNSTPTTIESTPPIKPTSTTKTNSAAPSKPTTTTSTIPTTTDMPRGTVDPYISVDIYKSELAYAGTTLLADNHIRDRRRIIEVNMLGEIIWEYVVPGTSWIETELLPNNNILYTVTDHGVYEVDRSGKIVWQYLTSKIDHDADRLPNGNTIFVFGMSDQKSDAQVTEVNPKGEIVWQWYAKDYFDKPPYNSISEEGSWCHTNAVTRMPNGNTLISLRNFDFVVEVDPKGAVVRTIGEGICNHQHDPEIQPNGNILLANHGEPNQAMELDPKTGKIVWKSISFKPEDCPVRDANRLPNGNTLITATTKIVEVTPQNEIVWQLTLKGITLSGGDAADLGFYKADRISAQK
jgi:hypothetical protein